MPQDCDEQSKETIHDLWLNDPVCKAILTGEHGEEGYQQLLGQVKGRDVEYDEAIDILKDHSCVGIRNDLPSDNLDISESYYHDKMLEEGSDFWINKEA